MILEPINNKKLKIKLSNTESVSQNIYKYTSLDNIKETKSNSSTSNYFLTTNENTAKELMKLLNDETKTYILDVEKTKQTTNEEMDILKKYNLDEYFKGNLKPFYDSFLKLISSSKKQITLGEAIVRLDGGGKYNIYFENSNPNVELFRNSILAVLCDVVIEIYSDYYLVYTKLKEDLNLHEIKIDEKVIDLNTLIHTKNEEHNKKSLSRIIEISKQLEIEYSDELIKELILECYKVLNRK